MLHATSTDHFHPLVPKAHNCESQNLIFPLHKLSQQKSVKANWQIFIFCTLGMG